MNCVFYEAEPVFFIFYSAEYLPRMLYYVFMTTFVMGIFMAVFLYTKAYNTRQRNLLIWIFLTFSINVIFYLITWVSNSSHWISWAWVVSYFTYLSIYIACYYFFYDFIKQNKISKNEHLSILIPLFLILVYILSSKGLSSYESFTCNLNESIYLFIADMLLNLWILLKIIILSFDKIPKKIDKQKLRLRKTITMGIWGYLMPLFITSHMATFLVLFKKTDTFAIELYGFIGFPIFIFFIVYAITRYGFLNIMLEELQAVIFALLVLIGSQIFYIKKLTDAILTVSTLIIAIYFGLYLIKKNEKDNQSRTKKLEQLNQELLKHKQDLENTNQKLEKDKQIVETANQELIKLDQAKTEFINIASHQLRTPVTVIKGIASMSLAGHLEKFPAEDRQQFYESLWSKSRKLEDIIKDILSAASLTNRKYTIEANSLSDIHLETFFTKIIQDFELELQEKNLTIDFEIKSPGLKIQGQKDDLEDALSNLIDNAIRYTETTANQQGSIKISIDQQPNNQIRIVIADNGIGISEDEHAKIFEKFFRAKNAKQSYTDGSGLGLFIVKEIIEGHGGSIKVESVLDQGTTITITLPNPRKNL